MLERARYGKRSEKLRLDPLNEEQQAFVFDEIETGLPAIRAELDKGKTKAERSRPPRPGTLERLAAGWPNYDIDALMPWNYPTRA